MASTVTSQPDCLQWCLPNWFAPVPKQEDNTTSDWCEVSFTKRDKDATVIYANGKPAVFTLHLERSTGDLYGRRNHKGQLDRPHEIAWKSFGILVGTSFYAVGGMLCHAAKIIIDITSIFWRYIPQAIHKLWQKGVVLALVDYCFSVCLVVPNEVVKDLWRIVRTPLFALGLMGAAFYGMFSPLEGRKWMARIELEWHEGYDYHFDPRSRRSDTECKNSTLEQDIQRLADEEFWYLGYCMQKRGNIDEKVVSGKRKWEIYTGKRD